ncbi:MAG: sigma-70 family RNA polymerase sigma factor [Bacteroidaceae bacterium]|nr:sigma-70 family RNA polymerase sigma factor [Bacteroidaceae bacterium]
MKPKNDEEIIERMKDPAKREKAFEMIVNQYSESLYWTIRRIVTYHDDADDVLQNTFIKAWTSISSFRGESKLSTWLNKIAYRESLTFLEKQRQSISLDDTEGGIANTLEGDPYFDGDETQKMLEEALNTLPAKQKAVFTMKYFEEKKYEEIAEITGTSVGALKASFHIAVEKITNFFNSRD